MNDKTWPAMSIAQAHAILTAPGMPFEMEEKTIRGVPTRVWKNAPPTLRDIFLLGRGHGDKIFLTYEDDRASFEGFARATIALAHRLQADGVAKGDRVAIVMRNLPEWPVAYFAAAIVGAIVTPLNAWWTGPELEYGLTDSGAKVAIVDAERLERIAEHLHNCPDLKRVYVARAAEEIAHPIIFCLEDVTGRVNDWAKLPERPLPDVPIEPEDDATIFYTSGTTGKPKGALATHRNIVSNLMASGLSVTRSRSIICIAASASNLRMRQSFVPAASEGPRTAKHPVAWKKGTESSVAFCGALGSGCGGCSPRRR